MNLLLQIVYILLHFFLILLLARLVMEVVQQFARSWVPKRSAAVALELLWTVTDPPVKMFRRLIPPLRLGAVSLDLGFMVLLFVTWIAKSLISYMLGG